MRPRSKVGPGLLLACAFGILSGSSPRAQSPSAPAWAPTHAPLADWRSMASSADGLKLVAASAGYEGVDYGGIYTSTDGGETWSKAVLPTNDWTSVTSSSDGLRLAAVSTPTEIDGEWIESGIYTSSDGGTNWIKTGAPADSWSAVASSSDGTRLVAASTTSFDDLGRTEPGMIYLSPDAGLTWDKTDAPGLDWISVASSADGRQIVAATAGGDEGRGRLFVSKGDGGLTWHEEFPLVDGGGWSSVAMSADGRMVAATARWGGVSITSDILRPGDGVIWEKANVPEGAWTSVACSADGTRLVAVAERMGDSYTGVIVTSEDAGAHWTLNQAPDHPWRTVASSADGAKLAAGAYRPSGGAGGRGYPPQPIYTLGTPYHPWIIRQPLRRVVAPGDPVSFTVEAGGIPLTYQWQKDETNLTDGANLFGTQTASLAISHVSPADVGTYSLIASNALGVTVSSAASLQLASWTRTSAGSNYWAAVASSADGRRLIAGANPGPLSLSTDSGATWKICEGMDYSGRSLALASSADGSRLFAARGANGIYSSDDGGAIWRKTSAPTAPDQTQPVLTWKTVACSSDGTTLIAACSEPNLFGPPVLLGEMYLSADVGAHWRKANLGANNWSSVASSADGTKLVAATGGVLGTVDMDGFEFWWLFPGPIYCSSDSGVTWIKSGAPEGYWQSVACSADGARIVAVQSWELNLFLSDPLRAPGRIYVSSDFGQTWTESSAPERLWKSVAMSADGSRLAATCALDDRFGGNQDPLYISTDGGQTWVAAAVPAGDWPAVALSSDGHRMVAVAQGGGIWLSPTSASLNVILGVSRAAEGISLSWPATASALALQQCSDLGLGHWSVISATPVAQGANQTVTLPSPNGQTFYRLIQP
ncbi:MAG: immunoglobulin domain-containing protein [Verrucomicrobiae bacterium]|nr:immunoglobulin domain-containing protein [Verrucomicrobiae bacterium]